MTTVYRAAEVIAELSGDCRARIVAIAEMLDEAGLLTPTPLREEWGLLHPSGNTDMRRDRAHAESGVGNGWAVARRYVSDWLPVDRAEGGGRAEQ